MRGMGRDECEKSGAKPCLEKSMSPPFDWQLEGTSAWLNELRRADQPGGEYSHNEKESE